MNEQKPSDVAIIDLTNALQFAEQHLSPDQFAQTIAEALPKDFLTMVHGKLVTKILES